MYALRLLLSTAVATFSQRLSACTDAVQLNSHKTEVPWCTTSRRQYQLPSDPLPVAGTPVLPVSSVCNLGIFVDGDLVMRTHVQRTVSRCFAALRQLRQIRRYVTADTLRTLVVSLVLSQLDYGNSVLAGLPVYLVARLQSVLNASARLSTTFVVTTASRMF